MCMVVFVRKDGKPNEEYFYHLTEDAVRHFLLFEKDNSNLYSEICLVRCIDE